MENNKRATELTELEKVTEYTAKLKEQRKASLYHDASVCEQLEASAVSFADYIERDGEIFELVNVEPNTATRCPQKHNGATATYKLVTGAIGYDC